MLEFYYIELDPLIKTNSGKNHICWAIVTSQSVSTSAVVQVMAPK